jgi:Toprim-like
MNTLPHDAPVQNEPAHSSMGRVLRLGSRRRLHREALRGRLAAPVEVAEALCLRTRRVGADGALVQCPWHADNNPSCSLFVGTRGDLRAFCHACGASGDVFDLIAQVRGLDVHKEFNDVLREADAIAGREPAPDMARQQRSPKQNGRVRLQEAHLSADRYDALARRWLELCQEFQEGGRGRQYLAARGLLAQADAAGVRAIPDDGEFETRCIVGALRVGGSTSRPFSVDDLDVAGIVQLGVRGGYSFRWREHLVLIPWVDVAGAITAVQQRYVGERDVDNKYVWPPGRMPKHAFGIQNLRDNPAVDVVIVEGALDVLARRELARMHGEDVDVIGIPSAGSPVACLPTERLTGRRVRVSVDRDPAGERAAAAIHAVLRGRARGVVRAVPRATRATDWNDQLLMETGPRGTR